MSDTFSSYSESFVHYDKEKTAKLYRNIKKMLQEVEKLVSDVNTNYKSLEVNMNRATELITAIQISDKRVIDEDSQNMLN